MTKLNLEIFLPRNKVRKIKNIKFKFLDWDDMSYIYRIYSLINNNLIKEEVAKMSNKKKVKSSKNCDLIPLKKRFTK